MSARAAGIAADVARTGPITFADFMARALYDPRHGYYASGRTRTGRSGDYLTSPELDPAYGELWARAFEQLWDECGRPERFDVVELGPGEGSFAEAVARAARPPFRDALALRLVERVPALRERQRRRLAGLARASWCESLAGVGRVAAGCVFANEVLDNQPVHLVEARAGRLEELWVVARDGGLALEPGPPSSDELAAYLARVGVELRDGHRYEVGLAAERVARAAGEVVARGAVVIVDYGASASSLADRPAETLLAYDSGGVDDDVLRAPGERDVTAHVNWTAVGGALEGAGCYVRGPVTQRAVLGALGVDEVFERLRAAGRAPGATGREVVRALSRRQAVAALVDPGGLGGRGVVVGLAGVPSPPFARVL